MTKSFTNKEVADILREVSAALLLTGANQFRVLAYDRAAESIEHLTSEVKDYWDDGKLNQIPGVGASISQHLDELFKTGKVRHFEMLLGKLPPSIFPLLSIPGFGPKKAYKLVKELKLTKRENAVDELEKAAKEGKIASIEGFGAKSEKEITDRIGDFKGGKIQFVRMNLPYASKLADKILAYLRMSPDCVRAEPLGSLRRKASTIGDIDVAVATDKPASVLDYFVKFKGTERIIEKGTETASIVVAGGRQIDLMCSLPEGFGSLLQHFTGSKEHNIRLRELALKQKLSLSEHGIKNMDTGKTKLYSNEEAFYKSLGLLWIPPEIRENRGEIELAKQNTLPKLIQLSDIKGDIHMHCNYNLEPSHDLGVSSVKDLLARAGELKYEYIGISDHNPSVTNHTQKQIVAIMKKRKEYIEQQIYSTKSVRVQIFIMLEIDILTDGKIALPEEGFDYIDAALVSLHSSFDQDRASMTKRVLTALAHPKAKIFAHPTGRLLGKREGVELDWEKIFAFCKEHKKAVEINSWPERLDLPDTLVRQAIGQGVKLVIDTDSHAVGQMENMRYGVDVARRGWAQKGDILNALPYNAFKKWLLK